VIVIIGGNNCVGLMRLAVGPPPLDLLHLVTLVLLYLLLQGVAHDRVLRRETVPLPLHVL